MPWGEMKPRGQAEMSGFLKQLQVLTAIKGSNCLCMLARRARLI